VDSALIDGHTLGAEHTQVAEHVGGDQPDPSKLGYQLDMTSKPIKGVLGKGAAKLLAGGDEPTPDITGTTTMTIRMVAPTADPNAAMKAMVRQMLKAAGSMEGS
jgi:hypothetical protein